MNKILRLLRYDLPLHFVLLFTNWLPDNVPFLKLRGTLARPFFKQCEKNLRLGRNLVLYNPSSISIGKDVYIAYGTWISAGGLIVIADEVTVGPYCVIVSSDHQQKNSSFFNGGVSNQPIYIDKGCWLGAHAVVTAGCHIGQGSLIGAGAICTNEIPQGVLAGGIPAKVIKRLNE